MPVLRRIGLEPRRLGANRPRGDGPLAGTFRRPALEIFTLADLASLPLSATGRRIAKWLDGQVLP